MGSETPKQFLPVGGLPILMHTLRRFRAYSDQLSILLVLPAAQIPVWAELCEHYDFRESVEIVPGGATRFQSVRNGLARIAAPEGLVAVHDGVRPFVTTDIIRTSFETAARTGSAVACVPAKDSIRLIGTDGLSQAMDRAQVRLVQTPQTFRLSLFRRAFEVSEQPHFTDCASVVEYAGFAITLVEGSYENIKITTPGDLQYAAHFLNRTPF